MPEKISEKILFDTLNYARLLKNDGVEKADTHATALVTALSQNIYTKDEVDMRLERALRHFEKTIDKRFHEIDLRFEKFDKRFDELELRVEKAMNRNLITTVSILGGLMTIMQVASTITHIMWR